MSEHKNKTITKQDRGIVLLNEATALIEQCTIEGCRVGLDARGCGTVDIKNSKFIGGGLADQKYAYGIRLGYSNQPDQANTLVRIQDCEFRGFGNPSGDYAVYNRDHIASEVGNTLWVKDSVFDTATDACIDAKGMLKLKKCSFKNSHRLIRVWDNTTVIAVDCHFFSAPSHEIFWFYNKTSKLILKNCTFDGAQALKKEKIGGDSTTPDQIIANQISYPADVKLDTWFDEAPSQPEGKKYILDIPALELRGLEIFLREIE